MKDVRKQKYEAPRRRFPGSANVTVTAVQERSLGYARDDDGAKCYQNSAALRSFDSVFIISDKPFLRKH